ncbi:amidohydrolase family protein [Mesomycoplasma ovipneumoniae]|uniref:amidohydrolase family protein n=1 Tax=Mesomycoplasma ovipneumoniae TaxID=29562 RepID=UPI00296565B9|nr:amidohydrolase family protein [Mesomycoplasma ovipneumoniae]MDW2829972.1 amidohydrolase family protein [Mesomycoplasma ovipneumoniae]MDW2870706.1 amidohydrolase family protein [Mesomycoplasma ovipneumoniae]
MLYKNLRIISHLEEFFGWIELDESGTIVNLGRGNTDFEGIDCKNNILLPAFIDSHTHGGYGFSFDDFSSSDWEKNFLEYKEKLHKFEGVAAIFGTTVTQSWSKIQQNSEFFSFLLKKYPYFLLNWYLEGPFISVEKKGAHDPNLIIPAKNFHFEFLAKKFAKKITVVIAPERNSPKLIDFYHKSINFAIGHSNCFDFEKDHELKNYRRFTHFFNGSSNFDHRNQSLTNLIFESKLPKNFLVELITDGLHIRNSTLKFTIKNLKKENWIAVSDSLAQKGLKDGFYNLGNLETEKKGDLFYLKNSEQIAGSGMSYLSILKNLKKNLKLSWQEIVFCSSYNVAKTNNLLDYFGTVKVGQKANFVIVDDDFSLKMVVIFGQIYRHF